MTSSGCSVACRPMPSIIATISDARLSPGPRTPSCPRARRRPARRRARAASRPRRGRASRASARRVHRLAPGVEPQPSSSRVAPVGRRRGTRPAARPRGSGRARDRLQLGQLARGRSASNASATHLVLRAEVVVEEPEAGARLARDLADRRAREAVAPRSRAGRRRAARHGVLRGRAHGQASGGFGSGRPRRRPPARAGGCAAGARRRRRPARARAARRRWARRP